MEAEKKDSLAEMGGTSVLERRSCTWKELKIVFLWGLFA